jgi:hypothetical protein
VNERRLQNKKHLSARFTSILRKNILEIRAHALLMACAKAITLSAKDHFSVSTEDYSTAPPAKTRDQNEAQGRH